MTETEDVEYDAGPTLLRTETKGYFLCQSPEKADGQRYLFFAGLPFPSLPHVQFGLALKATTTQEEANALAEMINKHCLDAWASYFDRGPEWTDATAFDENGLAVLE